MSRVMIRRRTPARGAGVIWVHIQEYRCLLVLIYTCNKIIVHLLYK